MPARSRLHALCSSLGRLAPLSDESWAAGEPFFTAHRLAAGEHVIGAGDVVDRVYFLTSGLARYYYLTPGGKELNKSFSTEGQVLSSISSLVEGAPSPFFVQALEPSECLSIKYADVLALGEKHRQWEVVARRLVEILAIKKELREADFLLLSAAERYQKFLEEHARFVGRIPNYHIASYLGITEVALSRIRGRLGIGRVNRG